MEEYTRRFRPLLIFSPCDDGLELEKQRAELNSSIDGLRERDLVLIEIVGDRVDTVLGPACDADAASLRAQHGVAGDRFAAVLVGKDSGIKLKSETPISTADLFSLIDAMPMRRQEMLRQND